MTAIYLIAFLAPCFYALSILIESVLSLDIFKKPATMCFFVSLTNSLFVPLIFFLGIPSLPTVQNFLIYIILAILDIIYLYPYYIALKRTDTSIVSALFTTGKIFVPILSYILLKDVLTPVQYVGFFTILFASVLLTTKQTSLFRVNNAFYLMLIASFLWSLRMILAKYTLISDPIWVNTLIYPNLLSGTLVFTCLMFKNLRKDIKKHTSSYFHKFKVFVLNEFISFLALVSTIYALSRLSPVVSAAIEATSPLFLLVFASILPLLFHRKFQEYHVPTLKKVICFVLIIIGVIFVAST
ncbi:MAG: EamA family transporter [Alphaproteobacteria bacterium]|nr:EamA family transporter [Alphaproteobacteria bacterium]